MNRADFEALVRSMTGPDVPSDDDEEHEQPNDGRVVVDESEPLLVSSFREGRLTSSYPDLALLVRKINFNNISNITERPSCRLTPELTTHVLSFLVVQRVKHDAVRVVGCSSCDGSHDPSTCLIDNETTWWMSDAGTMPLGCGDQYVEFQLVRQRSSSSPPQSLCRLSSISLKIPPLPLGPLSVKEFEVFYWDGFSMLPKEQTESTSADGSNSNSKDSDSLKAWKRFEGPPFLVANRSGWQRFPLILPQPNSTMAWRGIDVHSVRVVCLRNQISAFPSPGLTMVRHHQVGYFAIRFD